MTVPNFPGNSKRAPTSEKPEDRKVEQVVTTKVFAKKQSLGARFGKVMFGGDTRGVIEYVITDVLLPQAREMITEAVTQGFERLVYGDSRSTRRPGVRPPGGGTPYNSRYIQRGNNPIGRVFSGTDGRPPPTIQRKSIDQLVFGTRMEADMVLKRMLDVIQRYDFVTLNDLHTMVGWTSDAIDTKWGWDDLDHVDIRRVRTEDGHGYMLMLPESISLD